MEADPDPLRRFPHPATYMEGTLVTESGSGIPIEEGLPKARWEFEDQIFSAADWHQLRKHITPRGWGKVYIRTRTNQIDGSGYAFEDYIAIMRPPEGTPHPPWGFSDVAVDFESLRPITDEEHIFRDHFEDGEINPALWTETEERIGSSFMRFKPLGQSGAMLTGSLHLNGLVRHGSAVVEARFRYLYDIKMAQPARRFDLLRMFSHQGGVYLPSSGVQLDPYTGNLYAYIVDQWGLTQWYDPSAGAFWSVAEAVWVNIDIDKWYVLRFTWDTSWWLYTLIDSDGVTLGFTFAIPIISQWGNTAGSYGDIVAAIGTLDSGRSWIDFDFCKAYTPTRGYEDDPENLP